MAQVERGARSKAIREYLKSHSSAGPKEIVAALKEQGVEVTVGLASNIKYGRRNKARRGGGRARVAGRRGPGRTSASEAIRGYIRQHPSAMPKEIRAGLSAQGIKVTGGLISNVKYHMVRREGLAPAVRVAARRTSASAVTFDQLHLVKKFADSFGGVARVRQALESLAQLQ